MEHTETVNADRDPIVTSNSRGNYAYFRFHVTADCCSEITDRKVTIEQFNEGDSYHCFVSLCFHCSFRSRLILEKYKRLLVSLMTIII